MGLAVIPTCLAIAGAADNVSVISAGRSYSWPPDGFCGRISSAQYAVGAGGPGLGNARAELVAGLGIGLGCSRQRRPAMRAGGRRDRERASLATCRTTPRTPSRCASKRSSRSPPVAGGPSSVWPAARGTARPAGRGSRVSPMRAVVIRTEPAASSCHPVLGRRPRPTARRTRLFLWSTR